MKLTKNADPSKYEYSGHGIRFNFSSQFSCSNGCWSKNVIAFGADMSSSVYVDNKKRYLSFWLRSNTKIR